MTDVITHSYSDLTRWGSGLGGPLSEVQWNINFWVVETRLAALEDHPVTVPTIVGTSAISPVQFNFVMSDASLIGPVTLPQASWTRRRDNDGHWAHSTIYAKNDVFDVDGSLYITLITHTSAPSGSFDPDATDGLGHQLYGLLLTAPSDVLPIAGLIGQALIKRTTTDFDVEWGTIFGLPAHGTTGQKLIKASSTEGDVEWQDDTLDALADVVIDLCTLTTGCILVFDHTSSKWINEPQSSLILTPFQRRSATRTTIGTSTPQSLDPTLGDVFSLTPIGDLTINAASAPVGARITVVVTTSGTSSFTITFSTSFKSTGTLATGTADSKVFTISFVGDGTNFNETSRTTAM